MEIESSPSPDISSNNNSTSETTEDNNILINEETILILNSLHYKSKNIIMFTKSLLCKLLSIQEDDSDSYSDEMYNELYKKINSFSENSEYFLKSYGTFYDKEKQTINVEEVTFLAQIWTGDMYNCNGNEALLELLKELNSDFESLKHINF